RGVPRALSRGAEPVRVRPARAAARADDPVSDGDRAESLGPLEHGVGGDEVAHASPRCRSRRIVAAVAGASGDSSWPYPRALSYSTVVRVAGNPGRHGGVLPRLEVSGGIAQSGDRYRLIRRAVSAASARGRLRG